MKRLFCLLLLFPALSFAQKNNVYIKITNPGGIVIKGTSVARGFERQIEAFPFQTNSTANDTRVRFTMPSSAASGELRALVNTRQTLQKAEVAITTRDQDRPLLSYKVNMEKIVVEACNDVTDANGNMVTEVVLRATRIGWTYYTSSKGGVQGVSGKNGWDAEKSVAWTAF